MGGPIVRSGASPEFSKNWDSIFGNKKSKGSQAQAEKAKSPKKNAAKKKAAKKAK